LKPSAAALRTKKWPPAKSNQQQQQMASDATVASAQADGTCMHTRSMQQGRQVSHAAANRHDMHCTQAQHVQQGQQQQAASHAMAEAVRKTHKDTDNFLCHGN
jgi:hypothetical protein